MIQLTRLNRSSLILNSDQIEHIQATPDTLVTMNNGHTYVVLEHPGEIVTRVAAFRRRCQFSAASEGEAASHA
jgi:flagellar protein FlbD